MGTGIHQFTLQDADGGTHDYVVTEHPAGEGVELMFELLGLGAPTVLGLATAALRSETLLAEVMAAVGPEAPPLNMSELASKLGTVDLEKVGTEISRALGSGKAPGLTMRLIKNTFRDGRPLPQVFGQAFQANYWELNQLLWKVCTINRFFPVPSTSASSSSGKA